MKSGYSIQISPDALWWVVAEAMVSNHNRERYTCSPASSTNVPNIFIYTSLCDYLPWVWLVQPPWHLRTRPYPVIYERHYFVRHGQSCLYLNLAFKTSFTKISSDSDLILYGCAFIIVLTPLFTFSQEYQLHLYLIQSIQWQMNKEIQCTVYVITHSKYLWCRFIYPGVWS